MCDKASRDDLQKWICLPTIDDVHKLMNVLLQLEQVGSWRQAQAPRNLVTADVKPLVLLNECTMVRITTEL